MTLARNIAQGEYYHIFNRGFQKELLFRDKNDWIRFLFDILHSQSSISTPHKERAIRLFSQEIGFSQTKHIEKILTERFVEIVAFCLMPNHFHLIVHELQDGGASQYMQKVGTAYTKYFNTKYESSGHVFQGRYKSVHVKDDRQLTYLSAYIHRNPRELRGWKDKEFEYPWSSLQDYTKANRWGGLIVPDIIAGQFDATSKSNYADFVRTSTAKMIERELADVL